MFKPTADIQLSSRTLAALVASACFGGSAVAGPLASPALQQLTMAEVMAAPPLVAHRLVQAQVKRQSQQARQPAPAGGTVRVDIEPAQLVSANVSDTVNVQALSQSEVRVNTRLHDNYAGVAGVYVTVANAYDQYLSGGYITNWPLRSERVQVRIPFTPTAAPGTWRVVSISVVDGAGNWSYYDEAALVPLGNTQFTVLNRAPVDLQAPAITAAQILAADVSYSTPPPGTWEGSAPYVGVQLQVDDSPPAPTAAQAATYASGISFAYVQYCEPVYGTCFYSSGSAALQGNKAGAIQTGARVGYYAWMPPGDYTANWMSTYDRAGNSRDYSPEETLAILGTAAYMVIRP